MRWNEPYRYVEQYVIGGSSLVSTTPIPTGQRTIHLNTRYLVGLGDIKVYYNGVSAVKGREYEEVDPYTIYFNFDLIEGDIIEVEHLKMW